MVSPSKKRQIKGRVTAAFKSDRRGDKPSTKLPYKPLFNKKFYLDVKGYRGTASITADIQNLGGIVEEFLSREVNYVISTRGSQAAGGSSSEQQPSPSAVHTASPLTPQQPLSSLPSTSHDSPLNIDSPREDNGKKRVRTRAEVLLERACVRRQGTSDVLENARLWNVPVWPLAKLLKWIALLKEDGRYKPPQKTSAINYKPSSSSPKVQRLKAPFIKTESFSRQYKPLFKELTAWPELCLSNPPGVSPFADPKQAKPYKILKVSSVHKDDYKERHRAKERTVAAKTKDGGYCELCSTNFPKLKLHLQSDTHLAFIRNNRNYQRLDDLINGYKQGNQMPKPRCTSEAQSTPGAAKEEDSHRSTTLHGTTERRLANDKKLQKKDNSYIPMRFSGLMQAERRPSSLSSVTNKRLRKQIVFEIGETVHSGPTHLVQKDIKNEEVGPASHCVFPRDSQESACALPDDSNCPADIPSKHCSSSSSQLSPSVCCKGSVSLLPTSLCAVGLPPSGPSLSQSKCKVGAIVEPKAPLLTVHVPEAVVPKATVPVHDALAVPQVSVTEAAVPDVTVSEAALPEVTLVEAALPDVPVTKAATPKAAAVNIATKLRDIETPLVIESILIKQEHCEVVDSILEDQSINVTSSHLLVDPIQVAKEDREMVRLIQEVDTRIDSFCQKRSSRASKRFCSSEIEEIEIKTEPMSRAKRCTRTRKSSCRSDKSESETSDSRSVVEDPLCLDMVDKTVKRGRPKNGEPLLDEAATHTNTKYNGDVSVDLVNGAHNVKGRRVSRANSDESDLSSCSKSNGNIPVDHNNEKIDFSLLLEISEADREKFETKKAKIRRKTADWLLISETEQYYNEKEEIMRNKNKQDSDTESDDSDSDSKSDCSDENDNGNPPRGMGRGKRKQSRSVDDDDPKVGVKRIKEDLDSCNVRGRPIGSRTRKTRYDLTMLNDDEDDDDENFFGFPVSTPMPPSTQSCSLSSSSLCHSRGKGKGVGKCSPESSSCGKAGRKRLSDAERFLRDNREYYHFQETKERLRRSTSSSSGDKEKVGNGDDVGCHMERHVEKRNESKVKESTSLPRKRPSFDGIRRITRRTGGSIDMECEGEREERDERKDRGKEEVKGDRKVSVKEEKDVVKSTVRSDRRDGLRYEKRYEVKSEKSEEVKSDKRDGVRSEKKNEVKSERREDAKSERREDAKSERREDAKSERREDAKSERREDAKCDKQEEKKEKEGSREDKKEKERPREEKREREGLKDEKKEREGARDDKKEKECLKDDKKERDEKKEREGSKDDKKEKECSKDDNEKECLKDEKKEKESRNEKKEKAGIKDDKEKECTKDEKECTRDEKKEREGSRDEKKEIEGPREEKKEEEGPRDEKKEEEGLIDEKKEEEGPRDEKKEEEGTSDEQKEKGGLKEDRKEKESSEEKKEKEGLSEEKKGGLKEDKEKDVTNEETKEKEDDKKKELKDEKKNGLKDKKIGEILDHKIWPRDGSQEMLRSGKGSGKHPVKRERECVSTSEVSGDNIDSGINSRLKSERDIEDGEGLDITGRCGNAGYGSDLEELYFSFEGVPENECWYQTYQRFIDGIAVNEFVYDEDPLKFILPYEMPKEYIRDFISLKKGLLSKKKNDLADLVRKSPRCHASTLALFSDIIPTKKTKGAKVAKPVPIKVEEVSSDGTSTPSADSIRMQQPPPETFESVEELAILAMHMEHVMKHELESGEEASICSPVLEEIKDAEESDLRKTPPKKRGKKKRLLASSKSSKGVENIVKELKLFESPLAHEVDPAFIAGINDEVRDFAPENILARAALEVVEDSSQCLCNDRASCEDFSSADENTEASSECVSLCDSETIDSSTASELKPVRSSKKRRKNLTGWPKAQKKKKAVASHTSDDNDSAIGCDDSEPKRRGCRIKQDFCFLEQTTAQKLAALAANDRRASPRKKASVLYLDTWPVRFRTQK